MESSSDESFAWTNASNSSNSSNDNGKIIENHMAGNGLDEDSDYGINYKKRLHKHLFENNKANDESDNTNNQTPREKKNKRKQLDDDIVESPKKKKIKLEPESDTDTTRKKKKKKLEHSQRNEFQYDESHEGMSQDYSDLNITVKDEQGLASLPPKSKKQRKKLELNSNTYSNHDMDHKLNNSNIKQEDSNTESQDTSCAVDIDESYTKKKKKKSKKRQHSVCDDEDVNTEGKLSEDTISYPQQEKVEQNDKKSALNNGTPKHKKEVNENHSNSDKSDNVSDEDSANELQNHKSKISNSIDDTPSLPVKANKRVSRISDRIKFENEDNPQLDKSQVDKTISRKLKKFIKINNNLKPVTIRDQSDWALNADDEIWAIRCPQNIDVNAFLGTNIKLDRKCKIKINGQTYEGTMNNETPSVTVLSSQHNNYVIKKIPLSGTLHLRKRIPKVHIPDDNIILNNQTDFVPLPDTKDRHPLFGTNYKKAIKLPSAVLQQLKESYNDTINESIQKKHKKKKHKRDKNKSMDNYEETEEAHDPVPEYNETTIFRDKKKKNKKRKHDTDGEHSSTKQIKSNIDSSAVWESEQAIEENLFNF